MTITRRAALTDESARTNPLDVVDPRFAVGVSVLVGVPLLVAGALRVLS